MSPVPAPGVPLRFSNELKVGLLTIVAMLGAVWAVLRTNDRPGGVNGYELFAIFDSAQGVYPSSQVRIAGVEVGSVREIGLDPGGARLRLELRRGVELPVDTLAELKGEGVLGDRYVNLLPGQEAALLQPGGVLKTKPSGSDLDELQQKVDAIADDVKAITGALRASLEDDRPQDQVTRILDNVERITAQLEAMTAANRADVDAIADNVRALTEALNGLVAQTNQLVAQTGEGVQGELEQLRVATEKLDAGLARAENIARKIDEGEGTLGRLVNDGKAMDSIESTLDDVGEVVSSVSRLRTNVYYRGSWFVGSDPDSPGFTDNPVAGDARNIIGLELKPREDYWYLFEVVDHPIGGVTYTEHYLPETGTRWVEYERQPKYLFSFMFAKRFHDLVLRLGVKESAGGFGLDYLLLRDRVTLSADLYSFEFGSWPVLDDTPNLTLNTRWTPYRHLYIEGGLYNVILGVRYDYVTGYVGGGFTFTDDDFKWVLATLPFPG